MAELQDVAVPRVDRVEEPMQPERWLQVKHVLANVLEVAPADRVAVLDNACSDDPELRSALDELLPSGDALRRLFDLPLAPTLSTILRTGDVVAPVDDVAPLAPGDRIGPYEVVRLLGTGGMGQVYLARDARLERVVALKLVFRGVADDPVARARVLREARAAAALTHPGIAHVYDVIDHQGAIVIVMEYVEGTSLRERLAEGPCGIKESLRIAITIADALAHAHASGVVHCDIKPANIQLLPAGGVKILDFGIARRVVAQPSETTASQGAVAGTPGYMSPEQALGLSVDQRSDVFSLGVVLFEMLSGARPFQGGGPRWFDALSVLLADAPDYSALGPDTPAALRDVIVRALEWDPAARFQDAGDLQLALRDVLRGLEPSPVRVRPGADRLRRRLTIGVGVAVVALASLAGASWRYGWMKDPLTIAPGAERWYVDGVSALQEGAYLQASRALERAVQIDPAHALSWARLGEAQLELDQEPKARQSVLRAAALVPNRSGLPDDQRLRLEAAMAMAGRDTATALGAYSTLARVNPKSAALLVDLGRVHEAMEAMPQAVAHYRQAAQLDAENPAPFLRMGILFGRSGDAEAAESAFRRAEELYSARGRVEGVATVSYERGVMLDRAERLGDAVTALQRALQLATAVDSSYLRAAVLFKLSGVAGVRGRLDDAETHVREGLRISEGFDGLNAFGLVDLGSVYIYRKQPRVAEQHFRQAVDKAERAGAGRSEARARLALASILMSVGSVAEATTEANAALQYYDRTGFLALRAQALALLARAHERTGNLREAQAGYEALLKSALATGSQRQVADRQYSLGRFLLQREHYVDALRHADESLTRFRALNAPYDIIYGALLRADILWRMGRLDDADRELDAMFGPSSGAGKPSAGDEQARVLRRARVLLARNENTRAAALARRTLTAKPAEVSASMRAGLQRVLALALARSGRAAEALTQVDEAKAAAVQSADPLAISQAALARAEVLVRLRRYEETMAEAGPLAEQFSAAERHESAWLAARLAAQSASALRRTDDAARWRKLADEQHTRLVAQFDAAGLRVYEARRDLKPWS
jgi:tetratricopeptide (TPR) repeat protein